MKKITITFKSNKPFTVVRSTLSIIYHIHTFLANFEDAFSHKYKKHKVKSGNSFITKIELKSFTLLPITTTMTSAKILILLEAIKKPKEIGYYKCMLFVSKIFLEKDSRSNIAVFEYTYSCTIFEMLFFCRKKSRIFIAAMLLCILQIPARKGF